MHHGARTRRAHRVLQLRQVPRDRRRLRRLAAAAVHQPAAASRPDQPHRRPGSRRSHRRGVFRGAGRYRRFFPVRLADRRSASLALVRRPPRRWGAVRRAGLVPGGPLTGRSGRPRRAAIGHRRVAGHRGLPVHDVPPDRHRDDPRLRRPDDLHRGSRLRDLGRTGVPASTVRSAVAGRAAVRHRPVRVPGVDVAAHGEDVRYLGARVPAYLHAGAGANAPIAQARSRLHRPRCGGGGAGARPGPNARLLRDHPGSGGTGRRRRRRADLARRGGGGLGDVRRVCALQRPLAGVRLRAQRARGARRNVRGGDHRPAPAGEIARRAGARPGGPAHARLTLWKALMGRHPDLERRAELLDEVVVYLGRNGVAGVSLRPVARSLGVSVNALVHHFGSKDELVVAALRRAAEIQRGVEGRWRRQVPHLSTAELQRRWWRWINRSPEHLALVRLGLEAATLDATVSGLPGDVRAEQISFWREGIADGLIADGIKPEDAEREASLVKATFTGLVLDLLATGHRKRLTAALECTLTRLENRTQQDRGSKPPY